MIADLLRDAPHLLVIQHLPLHGQDQRCRIGSLLICQLLIDYLTDHPTSDLFALSEALDTSLSRTESLLQQLAEEGIVVVETDQGERLYKLKA